MERIKQSLVHLDTHIVLWLSLGVRKLSDNAIHTLNTATQIHVAPIVELELQYLFEIKRIKEEPAVILETLETDIGLKISDTNHIQVIKVAKGISWTRDVFDRLIVAETMVTHATLITKDEKIMKNFNQVLW